MLIISRVTSINPAIVMLIEGQGLGRAGITQKSHSKPTSVSSVCALMLSYKIDICMTKRIKNRH
jgi:hypothetical protein